MPYVRSVCFAQLSKREQNGNRLPRDLLRPTPGPLLLKARSEFNRGRGRVEEYHRRANGKHLPVHKERPPTGSLELEDR